MITVGVAFADESAVDEGGWRAAHRALSRLARERVGMDVEEGRCLLAALRSAVHVHLGFGGFPEYVERMFGYRPRTTREKLRVAEALEELPEFDEALRTGALSWCAVRELVRVVVPETAEAWLAEARGKTLRQLEELVAGKLPGDAPGAPYRPEARRHVLRFEVAADTYATFREAVAKLRHDAGASPDDDATLLALARHVLGGPRDAGRASYQVVLHVCPECGSGAQLGDGERVPVSSAIMEMARCDAQEIAAAQATGATRRALAHVGRAPRAKQTVPPSTRRAVLQRDEHRCRVPGCRNTTFLDLHHVVLRSEGGQNHADNLLTLCGAHHRAVHHAELIVVGDAASLVRFRHPDGHDYGSVERPRTPRDEPPFEDGDAERPVMTDARVHVDVADPLDVRSRVFAALRRLGFRESHIRAALADLVPDDGAMPTAGVLLRDALVLRLKNKDRLA